MSTKPTSVPEWASSGTAEITEPSSGKKAAGWIVEKPAHDYFNWLLKTIYLWCQYLSDGVFTGLIQVTNGFKSTGVTTTPGVEAVGSSTGAAGAVKCAGSPSICSQLKTE